MAIPRCCLALALLALLGGRGPAQAASRPARGIQAELTALAAKYRIGIVQSGWAFPVKIAAGSITGADATAKQVESYARVFVEEFGLYPPALVKNTRLKRVVLCRDLAFSGQLRAAVPDFENDTLFLDVLRGAAVRRYVRGVIHHEFFHIVDVRDDGVLYGDDSWKALNPKGFRYGSGGAAAQGNSAASLLTDLLPGFLTPYAATGVEEDKAELFSWMLNDPAIVAGRAEKDMVVAAKVLRLKELLAQFCPEMDAKFWRSIEARDAKRPATSPATRKAREPARR